MEFALLAVLAVSGQKVLDAIILAQVWYEGFFGDSAILANAVDTGVTCILHWPVAAMMAVMRRWLQGLLR